MFKNALVSVTNKTGLAELLKPLVHEGLRVVSTGGTAQYLRDHGIAVVEAAEQTGYPEVMDGRVRTLHPRIHIPLLARAWVKEDQALLEKEKISAFDLVICNLYQFSQYAGKNLPDRELVEHIDVGGPSMLRGAAKNFESITVLCDPQDYSRARQAAENVQVRRELAAKVFRHVSHYDQMIADELEAGLTQKNEIQFPIELTVRSTRVQSLRYGENPHQTAAWYKLQGHAHGWHEAEILQGKELSYNNLLDLEAAVAALRHFCLPTCVVLKHNNPCGVASDTHIATAVRRALHSDSVSSFGGIVALNREVDSESAKALSELFLECVVAPDFSPEALTIFATKKNVRVLRWRGLLKPMHALELRSITGGLLAQVQDTLIEWKDSWQVHGSGSGGVEEFKSDLLFAFRVVCSLKSNAIALACQQQSVGLGIGQVNRVDSVQHACTRMHKFFGHSDRLVMASDAFFPFPDSVEEAHKAGVKWIIQPGGSRNDEAVLKRAEELGIGMVITGERHFRH